MSRDLFEGEGDAPSEPTRCPDSLALEFSIWFLSRLEHAHPGIRTPSTATFEKRWVKDARLMLTRDGRSPEQLRAVADWLFESEGAAFWRSVVLSVPKFRVQFDRLCACMRYEDERSRARAPRPGGVLDAAQRILERARTR